MLTLIKIAWRNIWRNRLRSAVVITSIVLGIWAGLFIMAVTLGLNEQRLNSAIHTSLAHIQIHHPDYENDPNIKFTLHDPQTIQNTLQASGGVKAYAMHVLAMGMVNSAGGAYGVRIVGISPEQEQKITTIHKQLTKGHYFTKFKKHPVIIGAKLAHKIKADVRSKLVTTIQNTDEDIISSSFRIEGIFKTNNSVFDESTIFVREEDLREVTGLAKGFHEATILCNNLDQVNPVLMRLKKVLAKDKIQSWDQLSPELGYAQEMMGSMIYIFMGIVLLALSFSIINTMLMAVLERKKELGMLKAIGMNNRRIFTMITLETVFIAAIATPIGMLLSYAVIRYYAKQGIDLSAVAEGLNSLGVGSRIFTSLPAKEYWTITLMTLIVAFLASLFPARRALKLKPTEAISE